MEAPLRTVAAVLFAFALAAPAASLTIDNFEQGDFNVTDTTTPSGATFAEQSGLLTSNVVGGVRLERVRATGTLATAAAVLVTTPAPDDGATLTVPGLNSVAEFEFIYDGIANLNPDGRFGALNLDLSAFDRIEVSVLAAAVTADLQLTLWSSNAGQSSAFTPIANGINTFMLSAFPSINASDIQAIRLSVFGIEVSEIPTIQNIAAVPEPGTGLLVAAGLVGLVLARKRS